MLNKQKLSLIHLPTPIEYLPRLSHDLGVEFYIKRDDLTGLGMGGNKLRKLEYLCCDARQKGATMLLTFGGAQTNHGRLTAAAAAKLGFRCVIACVDDYPGEVSANILLDRIMGAELVFRKNDGRAKSLQYDELRQFVHEKYETMGEVIYDIPIGGSNVIGMLGYYECACELTFEAEKLGISDARVIVPVGSQGTYMGLFSGFKNEGSPLRLTGICIAPSGTDHKEQILKYYGEVKCAYNLAYMPEAGELDIMYDYDCGAYNNPVKSVRDAILKMAGLEAIILDPCYTGKAFAGVISMIEEGKIKKGEKIIFVHTGGAPGINTPHHRIEFERELKSGITII